MSFQVFIPHALINKDWAFAIASHLRLVGITPRLCELDIQPGMLLDEKIKQDIIDSDAVVPICTADSQRSIYTQNEIGGATILNKTVIPLVFPGCNTNNMGMLARRKWLEVDPREPQVAIRELQNVLRDKKDEKERRQALGVVILGSLLLVAAYNS